MSIIYRIPTDDDINMLTKKIAFFLDIDKSKIKFNYHTENTFTTNYNYPDINTNAGYFSIKLFNQSKVNLFTDFLYKLNFVDNNTSPINSYNYIILPLYSINLNNIDKYSDATELFWNIVNFLYNTNKTLYDLIDKINANNKILLYPYAQSEFGGDFVLFLLSYDLFGKQVLSSVNIIDSDRFIILFVESNNKH